MADLEALSTALTDTLRRGDDTVAWLQPVVLRLVAGGEPVTLEQVAQAVGRPVQDVAQALAGLPDTELDDAGRIVGWGITQRETPHKFNVDGRHLFTWCALDTLMFPALLGRPAAVSSPCHATGQPVQLQVEVDPDRVTHVHPPEAVVSIVTPGRTASIRGRSATRSTSSAPPPRPAPGWPSTPRASLCRSRRLSSLVGRWPRSSTPVPPTAAHPQQHTHLVATRAVPGERNTGAASSAAGGLGDLRCRRVRGDQGDGAGRDDALRAGVRGRPPP